MKSWGVDVKSDISQSQSLGFCSTNHDSEYDINDSNYLTGYILFGP